MPYSAYTLRLTDSATLRTDWEYPGVQIFPTVAPAKIAPGVQAGSGSRPRMWHPLNLVRCSSVAARAVVARRLCAARRLRGGGVVAVLATDATADPRETGGSLAALELLATFWPQPTAMSAVAIATTATGENL